MKDFLPILQECPLFDGLSLQDLSGILGWLGARTTQAKKGQTVFREGDTTVYIGIVLTGAVQLIREDYYGNRSIVAHISPTELFGESYAFSGAQALPVSVVAD